jgi:hypothetical protein
MISSELLGYCVWTFEGGDAMGMELNDCMILP